MGEPLYGLTANGIRRTAETNRRVLDTLPATGRRTRRVWNQGSGGAAIIAFQLETADCNTLTGTATVLAVPCPNSTGLSVGDAVDLVDIVGCFLTGNAALLAGLKGWAANMNADQPGTPKEEQEGCRWSIFSLCCPNESC